MEHKLTLKQYEQLNAKLSPQVVSQRKQGGRQVSYVEGHYVIRRANEIFGFENWTWEPVEMRLICDREYKGKEKTGWLVGYICKVEVTIYLDGEVRKTSNWGYGEGIEYNNYGQAHESAVKEAATDAMKRALIKYGDQFGLALYGKDNRHVGNDAPVQEAAPAQAADPKLAPQGEAGWARLQKDMLHLCRENNVDPKTPVLKTLMQAHKKDANVTKMSELPKGRVALFFKDITATIEGLAAQKSGESVGVQDAPNTTPPSTEEAQQLATNAGEEFDAEAWEALDPLAQQEEADRLRDVASQMKAFA